VCRQGIERTHEDGVDERELTAAMLASAPGEARNTMIGVRLLPLVGKLQPELAPKITGMLLDGLDNAELLMLLVEEDALLVQVSEAIAVLKDHNARCGIVG
jgi:hypothetical protein